MKLPPASHYQRLMEENAELRRERDRLAAENKQLIAAREANERANIASRRSIVELSERRKAERDRLAAAVQHVLTTYLSDPSFGHAEQAMAAAKLRAALDGVQDDGSGQ